MKRFWFITALLLSLCLLCACGQPTEEADEDAAAAVEEAPPARTLQVGVVVDTDYVNLRHGPSRDARIIDYIVAGSLLEVEKADPQTNGTENDTEDAAGETAEAAAEDTAETAEDEDTEEDLYEEED